MRGFAGLMGYGREDFLSLPFILLMGTNQGEEWIFPLSLLPKFPFHEPLIWVSLPSAFKQNSDFRFSCLCFHFSLCLSGSVHCHSFCDPIHPSCFDFFSLNDIFDAFSRLLGKSCSRGSMLGGIPGHLRKSEFTDHQPRRRIRYDIFPTQARQEAAGEKMYAIHGWMDGWTIE